jgi:TRAP-type mannitol/chloroaromatic compound transport system substrate-binding protein
MSGRRRFIAKAGGVLAAATAAVVSNAAGVVAQPKVQWRMSTAFPAALVGPWDHVAEGAYHQFVAG